MDALRFTPWYRAARATLTRERRLFLAEGGTPAAWAARVDQDLDVEWARWGLPGRGDARRMDQDIADMLADSGGTALPDLTPRESALIELRAMAQIPDVMLPKPWNTTPPVGGPHA